MAFWKCDIFHDNTGGLCTDNAADDEREDEGNGDDDEVVSLIL